MGRFSRDKGKRGEREFAGIMSDWLGTKVVRRLGQERDEGHDLKGIDGFAVEVKRVEKPEPSRWWRQATKSAAAVGLRPAVAYRQNGKPWYVMVELTPEEFATVIREQAKAALGDDDE